MEQYRKASKITVALSSENEFRRLGLEQLLRRIPFVGSFRIHQSAAELASAADADVDVFIVPIKELDEAPSLFIERLPRRGKVLLLLNGVPDECVSYIAAAPAQGFLSEHELSAETLADALKRMVTGEVPMPQELTRKLLERASEPYSAGPDKSPIYLTPREQQVLTLLVDGLSNKQIATRLRLSQHSVKRLVTNILAKLNSPNRTSAAAKALREGLVYRADSTVTHAAS
ncbi:response regulator transcription factor [Streptomyces sp. NPDC047928]|uniref:response regulator transcription factor n=1 Tax=unclassified Streptomyces TaxID=2593676 RepID=UPI003718BEC0